jgi:hypothetical protein
VNFPAVASTLDRLIGLSKNILEDEIISESRAMCLFEKEKQNDPTVDGQNNIVSHRHQPTTTKQLSLASSKVPGSLGGERQLVILDNFLSFTYTIERKSSSL